MVPDPNPNEANLAPHSTVGRATAWRIRDRVLRFESRPLLMGIVNVTPDSFSDGGAFLDADRAIAHALQLVSDGVDILDIGGESTRPYATPVSLQKEIDRVIPVVAQICQRTDTPVSIDTSKSEVAAAAIEAGAAIINDVTGLTGDPRMTHVASSTGAGVCAMHMQGTPATMQDNPLYDDVVHEIHEYLRERRDALVQAGISFDRICLDPGIGFGKTHEHNRVLLIHADRFHTLGCPLLVGHSRKGFIGKALGNKEGDRLFGTIGVAIALACRGVQILRVHDVRPVREALLLFDYAGGFGG